jgi:hypothetical protein
MLISRYSLGRSACPIQSILGLVAVYMPKYVPTNLPGR